jgi:hypothetical protein
MEYDAEIFPAHYTWKIAEYGFTMVFMINKLAMLKSCEIILVKLFLKNKIFFFAKNHCEIQVRTMLVCTLYSIKYSKCFCNVQIIKSFTPLLFLSIFIFRIVILFYFSELPFEGF